jgi:hypothetical protein
MRLFTRIWSEWAVADINASEVEVRVGDSRVQREVEPLMIAWLSNQLGVWLEPRRFDFGGGSHILVDGACADPSVLCEAWAHQGPPKSAQKFKVMNDAMKMVAAGRLLGESSRMILLFADHMAARPFVSGTWRAEALSDIGIEVMVASLDDSVRARIRAAQADQYR